MSSSSIPRGEAPSTCKAGDTYSPSGDDARKQEGGQEPLADTFGCMHAAALAVTSRELEACLG